MTGSNSAFVGSSNTKKIAWGKRSRVISSNRSSPTLRPSKTLRKEHTNDKKTKAVRFSDEKQHKEISLALQLPKNDNPQDLQENIDRTQDFQEPEKIQNSHETQNRQEKPRQSQHNSIQKSTELSNEVEGDAFTLTVEDDSEYESPAGFNPKSNGEKEKKQTISTARHSVLDERESEDSELSGHSISITEKPNEINIESEGEAEDDSDLEIRERKQDKDFEMNDPAVHASSSTTTADKPRGNTGRKSEGDDFFMTLLAKQKEVLSKNSAFFSPHAARKARLSFQKGPRGACIPGDTIEERWECYLMTLDDDFFTSTEALMSETSRVCRGAVAYKGLKVTEKNCLDMQRMFKAGWEVKFNLGQPTSTYSQFRVVVGQYTRYCVAAKIVNVEDLCCEGAIFQLMVCQPAIETFLNYFQIRSAVGTVMGKASQLRALGQYADTYFQEKMKERERGMLRNIVQYVGSVANVNKMEQRRQTSQRRLLSSRIGSGQYITTEDYIHFNKTTRETCKSLMRSIKNDIKNPIRPAVIEYLIANRKFLDKWNLTFTSLLVLSGGGQRPQVYTMLRAPKSLELEEMKQEAERTNGFKLEVDFEKRQRSMNLPQVIFPKTIYSMFKFHVQFVLPALHEKFGIKEEDARREFLILNTKTGEVVSSGSISKTIKRHIQSLDPELNNVTCMTIRSSYATVAMDLFRKKEQFSDMSESQFLQYLAILMNTSVEQLRETYIANESRGAEECAKILQKTLRADNMDFDEEDSN